VPYGRAGLMDLFRILEEADDSQLRSAAGHALSVLWARDELIAEEEKALVRRGYQVAWRARRRYPRALQSPIPFEIDFGVPFLREEGDGVRPSHLEWSYRVLGGRRASLEANSPWVAGPGKAEFELYPADFATPGPHKLVFQSRVRTARLNVPWEIELPHAPFQFEFDARLEPVSLLALPDEARASRFASAVRLVQAPLDASTTSLPVPFLSINDQLAILNPPVLEVTAPLPCDLSHRIEVEFAGVEGRQRAGALVVTGQGEPSGEDATGIRRFNLGPFDPAHGLLIEGAGPRSMRVRLVPDVDLGWSQPSVRSIWPGIVETSPIEVEIVRR
jgi:hypothetical protein